jgi:hypothetical protein
MIDTLSVISIVFFISLPFLAVGSFKERWPGAPQFMGPIVWVTVFVGWGLLMFALHAATGFPYWFRWLGL